MGHIFIYVNIWTLSVQLKLEYLAYITPSSHLYYFFLSLLYFENMI